MDTSQLYRMLVFASVVENGSLTGAANQLSVSRSMVSQHLKKLEQRLNRQLLNRTTRKINLTEDGRIFYQYCAELLQLAKQAEASTLPNDNELFGTLKICLPVGIGMLQILPNIQAFHQQYPNIHLSIVLNDANLDLTTEKIDLMLYVGKARGAIDDHNDHQLWQHICVGEYQEVMVASKHYIDYHGIPAHPDLLARHRWLRHDQYMIPMQLALTHEDKETYVVRINPFINCCNTQGLLQLALQGLGIAILPLPIVNSLINSGTLVQILPNYHLQPVGMYLTHNYQHELPPKVRAFKDFISQTIDAGQ